MLIAKQHPNLQVSGQSAESGGWIGRRPYLYADPIYPGSATDKQANVRQTLEYFFSSGRLRLAALPKPLRLSGRRAAGSLSADIIKGILWGAAIGDALGNTSESRGPAGRYEQYGEIRHYLPNRYAENKCIGWPSDDTQLTLWTLESLLKQGGPDLDALVVAYRQHRIYGIGRTMRGFFKKLDELGANGDIWEARQHSAGNGALMRVAGAFLPHAWTLDEGLFDTVALTSAFTHDDATSTAACIAFTHILVKLLWFGPSIIKPNFFWETFVETARELEGNVSLKSRVPNDPFEGSLCDFIEQRLPAALKSGQSFASVNKSWYSGAYLLETVPIVLFLLERYHHDPEEALVRAVMDTRDNDTIACIAGMVLGAVHGFKAWPERWRNDLSGCTQRDDFNRINHIYNMLRRFGGNGLKD